MSQFFSKYKFILIGIAVILVIFIGYAILKPEKEGDGTLARTVVSTELGGSNNANGLGGEDLDGEFVVQLLAIQNINFNTDFFKDPIYRALKDQSRPLGDRPVGRPNPFNPIGQDNGFVGTSTAELLGTDGRDGTGFVITSTSSNSSTNQTPRR